MQKTIIITGGTGGLGSCVVDTFLQLGYKVVASFTPGNKLEAQKNLFPVELDVLNENDCNDFIISAIKEHKEIQACLMLVGGFAMGNIANTVKTDLEKMYNLNFLSAYHIAKPVFEQMLSQNEGGRLVFIGARPALEPLAGHKMLAYSLSKGLLFHLAEMLNVEGKNKNVVSTVIVPSTIDTPANREAMPDAKFDSWVRPQVIADIIAFVCKDAGLNLRETVLKVYNQA